MYRNSGHGVPSLPIIIFLMFLVPVIALSSHEERVLGPK